MTRLGPTAGRAPSPIAVYQAGLRSPGGSLWLVGEDGGATALPVAAWRGRLDPADRDLVGRCGGPTLDVGCGPGRLVAAIAARGVPALGIDIAPEAVCMTRRRGALALRGDVFRAVPAAGRWHRVLLADGNIGIGGDPVRLLTRTGSLLGPTGLLLVEVDADTTGRPASGVRQVRLADESGAVSAWFAWGQLAARGVAATAEQAGLEVEQRWERDGRYFAALRRRVGTFQARQTISSPAANHTPPSTIAMFRP